jgi:hypothetical protein
MPTRVADLYDEDYYAWTRDQARALRRLADSRWNGPLDLEHLAEEVEDLGNTQRNAVLSQVERIIEHLLKLEHSREVEPRRGWIVSIDDARRELEKHLTPKLRRELEAALPELYRRERKRTARKLALYGEPEAAEALPLDCPYTVEQIVDEDWLPESE